MSLCVSLLHFPLLLTTKQILTKFGYMTVYVHVTCRERKKINYEFCYYTMYQVSAVYFNQKLSKSDRNNNLDRP